MESIAAVTEPHDPDLPESFRNAMGRMAATVTIISTAHQGVRHGMTATAVTSVSMDPPSLLVCVNHDASIHDPLCASGRFCINMLAADQDEHCYVFSGRKEGEARFDSGSWDSDRGIPYLPDAQASIFCDVDKKISHGTHTIFIGQVTEARFNGDAEPLLYLERTLVKGGSHAR